MKRAIKYKLKFDSTRLCSIPNYISIHSATGLQLHKFHVKHKIYDYRLLTQAQFALKLALALSPSLCHRKMALFHCLKAFFFGHQKTHTLRNSWQKKKMFIVKCSIQWNIQSYFISYSLNSLTVQCRAKATAVIMLSEKVFYPHTKVAN